MLTRRSREIGSYKVFLPTEHTQDQIEHKEGTQKNERNKIKPGPFISYGIINLKDNTWSATSNESC